MSLHFNKSAQLDWMSKKNSIKKSRSKSNFPRKKNHSRKIFMKKIGIFFLIFKVLKHSSCWNLNRFLYLSTNQNFSESFKKDLWQPIIMTNLKEWNFQLHQEKKRIIGWMRINLNSKISYFRTKRKYKFQNGQTI